MRSRTVRAASVPWRRMALILAMALVASFGWPSGAEAEVTVNWLRGVGTDASGTTAAARVTVDAAGNTYAVGAFTGTATFASAPGSTLTSRGDTDAYVAKYDPAGTFRWARRIGSAFSDLARDVAVGPGGQIVVVGQSFGAARFDTPSGDYVVPARGNQDIWIARFLATGELEWAGSAGGVNNDDVRGVTIDAWSRITITGDFRQTATFGSAGNEMTVTANQHGGAYVASYQPNGSLRWVRNIVSGGNAEGFDVVSSGGALFLTATFSGVAMIDETQVWAPNLYASSAVVLRLDPSDGHAVWILMIRSPSQPYQTGFVTPWAITAAGDGDLIIAARMYGVVGFATPGGPLTNQVTSAGFYDAFIVRLGSGGELRWARTAGGTERDGAYDAKVLPGGDIEVVGDFAATASWAGASGPITVSSTGDSDGFIARYSPTGTALEVDPSHVDGVDLIFGVTADATSTLRIAGTITAPGTNVRGFVASLAP